MSGYRPDVSFTITEIKSKTITLQTAYYGKSMISYYIEDIAKFHPDLEVEHIILASVSIMERYSDNHFCNFTLECHNIVSDLLSENGKMQICVKWRVETHERSFGIARVHQRKDLVEKV